MALEPQQDPIYLPFDVRAAQWIDLVFGGLHRVKIVFDGRFVHVDTLKSSMATYDDELLTNIVIASHWLAIRCEIHASKKATLQIYLHPRNERVGRNFQRHPGIGEMHAQINLTPCGIYYARGCLDDYMPKDRRPKTS